MKTEIKSRLWKYISCPSCLFGSMYDMRAMSLVAFLAVVNTAGAASLAESIRVYAIEPASFEYVFTAVVAGNATNPILSLNHRSGRTSFVRTGGHVGEYVVSNYQAGVRHVYNPTINSTQDIQTGRVSLCGKAGPPVVLELGKRLPQPGWMAYLVDLSNGNWWYVRESDVILRDAVSLQIGPVETNSVTLLAEGVTNRVSLISDAEIRNLTRVWADNGRKRTENKTDDAAEVSQDDSPFDATPHGSPVQAVPRPASRSVVLRYPSRTYFGTDYSCPTEYMVLPAIWNANGQIVRPTMIVPRRFETRSVGLSIETR